MAQSTREIRRRIKSVKSTQQITRAMQMVAAVKLNRVRSIAENSRPYVERLGTLMQIIRSSEMAELATDHPAFRTTEGLLQIDLGICWVTCRKNAPARTLTGCCETAKNYLRQK